MNAGMVHSTRGSFSRAHSSSVCVTLVLLCFGLSCAFVACRDRHESFYPALADADKDGAITRGWVPDDLLPTHSKAIHEVHEISPSYEWCAFEFPASESDILRKKLKSVDAPPPSVKRVPSPGVSWWPTVLTGNLDAEMIHKAGFQLYVVEKQATSVSTDILLFAVDWQKGRGFFYRIPESSSASAGTTKGSALMYDSTEFPTSWHEAFGIIGVVLVGALETGETGKPGTDGTFSDTPVEPADGEDVS